jgi:hypothetical protein
LRRLGPRPGQLRTNALLDHRVLELDVWSSIGVCSRRQVAPRLRVANPVGADQPEWERKELAELEREYRRNPPVLPDDDGSFDVLMPAGPSGTPIAKVKQVRRARR